VIVAVLQARTSSARLPGKVMLPLAGAPMLRRQIERITRSRHIDRLVVATSDRPEDACVAELAAAAGVDSYCGSLDNVLDRVFRAAEGLAPDWVVRLTGDCPLTDWEVIDGCIDFARDGGLDYASNALEPSWPDGLDVEVMTFASLASAWREADNILQIEHVTPFINRQPDRFRLGSFRNDRDLSGLRWTVDEPNDYEFVSRVYDALYPTNPAFTTDDILTLLAAQPELIGINAGIERNEGLRKTEEALKGKTNA
jgi:spore coat polysaccharide biosynthesis protein SpsF